MHYALYTQGMRFSMTFGRKSTEKQMASATSVNLSDLMS